MATVTMPQLGESVTEGTILTWLKKPGDVVKLDEPLCEIETEKVTAELPSPFEGTMGEILVPEGETVDVGVPLCEIAEAGAEAPKAARQERKPVAAGASSSEGAVAGWSGGPMAIPEERPLPGGSNGARGERPARNPEHRERFYSPAVMRLAQEHQIDLASIRGTGVGGRVTRKDVEALLAQTAGAAAAPPAAEPARRVAEKAEAVALTAEAPAPAAAPEVSAPQMPARPSGAPQPAFEAVPLSATRKKIAENMVRSNLEAPQAWTMVEADVTGLVARRQREKERFERQEGLELTLLPYFIEAVCSALREYPALNARWEGDELRRYHELNIAVAVDTEHGLVTPVVRNAGDLSVSGLAKQVHDLAQRAHNRKLRVEDIEGGTFTVNNTGSFGSIVSKPIVNYPQVAIVTMERAQKRSIIRADDSIAVRWMVNVCLSFDHRALDGAEVGHFLQALKERLEAIG